jgi:catabolite regulation protein CreA
MIERPRAVSFAAFVLAGTLGALSGSRAGAADEPDLIFKRSTVFKWLTPDDKLATYGLDDPEVEGVACHFTVPEKGGLKGCIGVAEEVSDISLACRQIGPINFFRPITFASPTTTQLGSIAKCGPLLRKGPAALPGGVDEPILR